MYVIFTTTYEYFLSQIGRSRLEPTGIIVLSVVMALASFQLIITSIQKIIQFTSHQGTIPTVELPTILIAAGTVGGLLLSHRIGCNVITLDWV